MAQPDPNNPSVSSESASDESSSEDQSSAAADTSSTASSADAESSAGGDSSDADSSASDDASSDEVSSSEDASSGESSSSDDSSSDESSGSDDSSSSEDASSDGSSEDIGSDDGLNDDGPGVIVVARTNTDLDHTNALVLAMVRIRLFDPDTNPMPNAPYKLSIGSQNWTATADGDGWVEQTVQAGPTTCTLAWGAGQTSGTYLYNATITLDFNPDPPTALPQFLQNLGYLDPDPTVNQAAFRSDYNYTDSDDIATILQGWHDDPSTVIPKPPPSPDAGASPGDDSGEDYG